MTKEELVYLTIKQLNESLPLSPENFKLEDPSLGQVSGSFPGPTVIWQFKVKLADNTYISDPLNSVKTIIVSYNIVAKQLHCYIYNREVNSLSHAIMADVQSAVHFGDWIPPWCFRSFREFQKLRKSLIEQRNQKEFIDYMKRLNDIFPATHEDEIFK